MKISAIVLEKTFFHLPSIDFSKVIRRDPADHAVPKTQIKGKRGGVFDGNVELHVGPPHSRK